MDYKLSFFGDREELTITAANRNNPVMYFTSLMNKDSRKVEC